MKTINRICQILAIVFGVGSLVLFFMTFGKVVTGGNEASIVGAQFGFGSKITVAGTEYDMAKSSDILFCFLLTAVAAVLSIFSFKSKTIRYIAPGVGIIDAVYMLVIALSDPTKFFDLRPLPDITDVSYTPFVLIAAIALFVFTAFAVAYLLIDDYIEVLNAKGEKLTIPKRIIRFFRDYKSEIKKIVWPGWKEVAKNTIIVLIMCVLVGAFIWLVDFGLGKLLELILGA